MVAVRVVILIGLIWVVEELYGHANGAVNANCSSIEPVGSSSDYCFFVVGIEVPVTGRVRCTGAGGADDARCSGLTDVAAGRHEGERFAGLRLTVEQTSTFGWKRG